MGALYTKANVIIAIDYIRVVHGGRGDYVEFGASQVVWDNLEASTRRHYYYWEWRSIPDHVKVYEQRALVTYADYRQGFLYVSPRQLRDGWQREEDRTQ